MSFTVLPKKTRFQFFSLLVLFITLCLCFCLSQHTSANSCPRFIALSQAPFVPCVPVSLFHFYVLASLPYHLPVLYIPVSLPPPYSPLLCFTCLHCRADRRASSTTRKSFSIHTSKWRLHSCQGHPQRHWPANGPTSFCLQ